MWLVISWLCGCGLLVISTILFLIDIKLARANERKLNRGILTLFVISVICFLAPPVMVFSLFLYYMIF
jgi:hypothetical protein